MFSFLVQSAIKSVDHYSWYTYSGSKPVTVKYRGTPISISKGTRFGVRPSVNKKDIRLVIGDDINRVITLTLDQAKSLSKGL